MTNSLLLVSLSPQVTYAAEPRITLATYTLSKADTKKLADNMKSIRDSSLRYVIQTVMGKYIPNFGWIAAIASELSSRSQCKQAVIDATNKGKRIKVTVTDYKNYHTS
jgi:hypothetical protein